MKVLDQQLQMLLGVEDLAIKPAKILSSITNAAARPDTIMAKESAWSFYHKYFCTLIAWPFSFILMYLSDVVP